MTAAGARRPRSLATLVLLALPGLAILAGLIALGLWQVHRRTWKHALIATVEQRVHADPVAPPGPAEWPMVNADRSAYTHIRMSGRFDNARETLVQAVTERGPGFWVLTPFATSDGFTLLVNRGFVPPERRDPATRGAPVGERNVTGLVRISEPGGGFLRQNDPAAGRWYSRDVAAIAAAHGLGEVAPYFVDADATPNPGGYPIGGLTIIKFPDNHLVYALTWFCLAGLVAGAMLMVGRHEWRLRR